MGILIAIQNIFGGVRYRIIDKPPETPFVIEGCTVSKDEGDDISIKHPLDIGMIKHPFKEHWYSRTKYLGLPNKPYYLQMHQFYIKTSSASPMYSCVVKNISSRADMEECLNLHQLRLDCSERERSIRATEGGKTIHMSSIEFSTFFLENCLRHISNEKLMRDLFLLQRENECFGRLPVEIIRLIYSFARKRNIYISADGIVS